MQTFCTTSLLLFILLAVSTKIFTTVAKKKRLRTQNWSVLQMVTTQSIRCLSVLCFSKEKMSMSKTCQINSLINMVPAYFALIATVWNGITFIRKFVKQKCEMEIARNASLIIQPHFHRKFPPIYQGVNSTGLFISEQTSFHASATIRHLP